MNTLRNKVQLIGNLGQKPEIITLDNGRKLAKLRLATNSSYKNDLGERIETVDWHNLVAWGEQAKVIEKYADVGKEMAIEGKLVTKAYETKEGVKRYATDIHVVEFLFLGRKGEEK